MRCLEGDTEQARGRACGVMAVVVLPGSRGWNFFGRTRVLVLGPGLSVLRLAPSMVPLDLPSSGTQAWTVEVHSLDSTDSVQWHKSPFFCSFSGDASQTCDLFYLVIFFSTFFFFFTEIYSRFFCFCFYFSHFPPHPSLQVKMGAQKAASEWRKLPLSLTELCIDTTLRCGRT